MVSDSRPESCVIYNTRIYFSSHSTMRASGSVSITYLAGSPGARSRRNSQSVQRCLHSRAADWLSENGYVDTAIDHALAAGRHDRAASLVQASWMQYFDAGLGTTVRGWLRALDSSTAGESTPTLVTAAWMAAFSGQQDEMGRLLAQLSTLTSNVALPDGTKSVESVVALIRGLFGFGGPVGHVGVGPARSGARDGWQHARGTRWRLQRSVMQVM